VGCPVGDNSRCSAGLDPGISAAHSPARDHDPPSDQLFDHNVGHPEFHAHHHSCSPSGRQTGRHVRQKEPLQRRLRGLHSWVAISGPLPASVSRLDLVLYRVVQGLGGALLLTNSAAIVTDAFRHGRIGFGLGVNQIAFAAGFLVGPVVGGILAAISWRWIFLVNVPLGVFGTLWGMARLREPVSLPGNQKFDWLGSLSFTAGLGALLLAASLVAFPMVSITGVYALVVVGILGLIAFFIVERRVPQPMLDLRLFRDKLFAYASAANALNGLARGAVLFILIFFLQGPYGLDPLWAGILMAPFGAAFMLVGPVSGHLSDRIGSRGLATAGLLVSAIALLGLATVVSTTPYWLLAVYMVLMGGGSGLFSSPNISAIMSSVLPEQRGMAAGTNSMLMNTGMMLSIVVAFPLVLARIPEDVLFHVFLYGGGMASSPQALSTFEMGMHQAFLVSFAITMIAAVVSYLRPSNKQ
jgi:MFS family permease